MNRITSTRTELYEALADVLPGRVAAMPPISKPYPAPYIWIDQPRGNIQFVGQNTKLSAATFPVWISYDGAVKAQVAGLDDLVAKVWDACLSVPAARPVAWNPTVSDMAGVPTRGVVVSVEATLGALTLCVEPTVPSPIPPELIPA